MPRLLKLGELRLTKIMDRWHIVADCGVREIKEGDVWCDDDIVPTRVPRDLIGGVHESCHHARWESNLQRE